MPQFVYVEMTCRLEHQPVSEEIFHDDILVEPIADIAHEVLFDCYTEAFSRGDAKFYQYQSKEEKERYFNEELGFPEVLHHPASFVYKYKGEVIGFALVLSLVQKSYHISCMCIVPEFQGHGLGKSMLNRIKNIALANECTSISLGTEPEMKAYQLYKENGFEVTGKHTVDI